MDAVTILLNILSMILTELTLQIIFTFLSPYLKKKEKTDEENAKQFRYVKLNKKLLIVFISLSVIIDAVGIIIFAAPDLIINFLGFNYIATIICWWIPLIFDNIFLYFLFTTVKYDDEKIVVKKVFSKPKEYKYDEITSFSHSGNLRVKTKNGSFILFNAMAGTKSLRETLQAKTKL